MVLGVGTLIILAIITATTAVGIRRYNAELLDAARELRTLDLLLAEDTGRLLQSVQLVLDNVADQTAGEGVQTPNAFAERMSTKAVHDSLGARVAGVPQLDAITLVGSTGKLVNFSRSWPIPALDLSDRDYFENLKSGTTNKTYLSERIVNRGSGTPTIYLARRIEAADGTFLGLALGAIELAYFDRFYASLHLERGNFIALWRQDGMLLARYPAAETGERAPPESFMPPASAWRNMEGLAERNWSLEPGAQSPRLVASRSVAGYPLQINVGRSKGIILSDWRREFVAIGSAVAIALLSVLVLMWALLRRFHAYEAVASASREREAAVAARENAEEALRQAQKMEAVGQLTGGVAHDFNNLLTVVTSSVELLRRPDLSDERRVRYTDAIADATERAAKLTGQLLAFARRQALKPEVFDVVANVAAVSALIDRLTGTHVEVDTHLPGMPCLVDADPNQFDTAIVNMAVNARDAMEGGGRLTITVRAADQIPASGIDPVRSGSFVAVCVGDTGVGIAPDLLGRVFEPFFTTKKVGEGTGLGLSQVFGFAKQSGGEVSVESVPGEGTSFTLFLPRVAAERMQAGADKGVGVPDVSENRGIRVLLVEDNEMVGQSTIQILSDLSYETTWVTSAEQALAEVKAGHDRFGIVFSDVVMRGMSGIELGSILRRDCPDLPIVLTSGYSKALAERGTDGFAFLQKPYARDDLSRILKSARSVAGRPPNVSSPSPDRIRQTE